MKNLPAINILLTFDYELPLGGITKSFDHSLFEPTRLLLDFAKNMQIPLVFFADIHSYIRFKEESINNYTDVFREQMQYAIRNNHDVQLHLHPHWLETKVNDHTFIPSEKFKLADFYENKNSPNINQIIYKGTKALTDICKEIDPEYKCIAYRGGGYNLAPRTYEIIASLMKQGIRYDSSVVPGYYFLSAQNKVDFRNIPDKPNWFISPENNLEKEGNNGLWEIPVASIPKSPFEVPTSLKMKKYAYRAAESRGRMIHNNSKTSLRQKFNILMANRMLTVDNYTYSPKYLMKILNYHIQKFRMYDEISLALIGHPKTMGNYSFELLEYFIRNVKKTYGNNARFTTFRNLK